MWRRPCLFKNMNTPIHKSCRKRIQSKNEYHAPDKSDEALNKTPEDITRDV